MEALQRKIGITFLDQRLLQSAFIHRSFFHEHPELLSGVTSNERLEFLGDAVLNFLTADWLFQRYPERTEGELTALRAALVKTSTLARLAAGLGLGDYVRISKGEDTPAARNRPPLLADMFEALLGAIFLDQGLEAARSFVTPYLEQEMEAIHAGRAEIDYRTRLQERAQAIFNQTPVYRMVGSSGPEHRLEFTIEVLVGERALGTGKGPNKQAAAQGAARMALEQLPEQ
jgi:ribonuclease III